MAVRHADRSGFKALAANVKSHGTLSLYTKLLWYSSEGKTQVAVEKVKFDRTEESVKAALPPMNRDIVTVSTASLDNAETTQNNRFLVIELCYSVDLGWSVVADHGGNIFNECDDDLVLKRKSPAKSAKEVLPTAFDRTTNTSRTKGVNIGWALKKATTKVKNYVGALGCLRLQDKRTEWARDQRPPVDWKDNFGCTKKPRYSYYNAPSKRVDCNIGATFTIRVIDIRREDRGSTVTMYQEITDKKKHTHTMYNTLHLDRHDKKELNKMGQILLLPLPSLALIHLLAPLRKSVREINKILGNNGRTKYEIRRSKIQQGLYTSKEDAVGAFEDLDNNYPEFMDSAQIVPSKFFISFCSPEMLRHNLPFVDQPIITDVTFKAVPKGYYLCSSVIYVKQLQKHVVFYQAIIKSNNTQTFKKYVVALFQKFGIKLDKFFYFLTYSFGGKQEYPLFFTAGFKLKKGDKIDVGFDFMARNFQDPYEKSILFFDKTSVQCLDADYLLPVWWSQVEISSAIYVHL